MIRSVRATSLPRTWSPIDFARTARRRPSMRQAFIASACFCSKVHDDLAEHLAALEPFEPALDVDERHLRVDHRREAARHLGEAVADVAQRGAERAEDLVLLLEELHQVEIDG